MKKLKIVILVPVPDAEQATTLYRKVKTALEDVPDIKIRGMITEKEKIIDTES